MDPTESRSPHQIILDSIADGVFTVDDAWRITSFNRAAERITGVPAAEALGQTCFDVFRADICQGRCALRHTIETGEELIDQRIEILNAAGDAVPISISTAVLRDSAGTVVGGVETFRDRSQLELLRREVEHRYTFADIVSKNHQMARLFAILPDVAESESTVLVEGASGTGKELVARALHSLSPRQDKPFVAVNCGALPDTLLESELFGYVKGAFTDAKRDKPGRFALANGGTLFLDEVGDISPALQIKLLRVLQERVYEPLGAVQSCRADVRIIAATNRQLREAVGQGRFREDLYYRLNIVRLELPPLCERREDIPLLVDHFIARFNARLEREVEGVSAEAMAVLMAHPFPGNVRELENAIEHAFVLCRGRVLEAACLPPEMRRGAPPPGTPTPAAAPLAQAEAEAIQAALRRHHGHRRRTAAELGIHPATLWRKMKRYDLTWPPP